MNRRQMLVLFFAPILVHAAPRRQRHRPKILYMSATAHSQKGETAAGTVSRLGTVAADPKVLPMGSRIRIVNAGPYSGIYSVEDTGPAINGHDLDIFMGTPREAKRFGRKRVKVVVLKYGDGEVHSAAK